MDAPLLGGCRALIVHRQVTYILPPTSLLFSRKSPIQSAVVLHYDSRNVRFKNGQLLQGTEFKAKIRLVLISDKSSFQRGTILISVKNMSQDL